MSYGFEIFSKSGDLLLSSNSTAGLIIDVIPITAGVNGSKIINQPLLKFGFIMILTGASLIVSFPGTGQPYIMSDCAVSIDDATNTVTWVWEPLVHGYSYSSAQIFIMQRD